jgi:hypothetical protein
MTQGDVQQPCLICLACAISLVTLDIDPFAD